MSVQLAVATCEHKHDTGTQCEATASDKTVKVQGSVRQPVQQNQAKQLVVVPTNAADGFPEDLETYVARPLQRPTSSICAK